MWGRTKRGWKLFVLVQKKINSCAINHMKCSHTEPLTKQNKFLCYITFSNAYCSCTSVFLSKMIIDFVTALLLYLDVTFIKVCN